MQDDEKVVIVLIELGPFDVAANIFQVERVEVGEALFERGDICGSGMNDVDPSQAVVADGRGWS